MTIRNFIRASAMSLAACAAIAVLSGAAFERLSRDRDARGFPPPGRMVEVNGHKIQIDCRGAGSPTVVLESGLDKYGSLAWAAVHDKIETMIRVCAYRRPGIMWSEPTGKQFDVDSAAATLHAALIAAGESAPWVMVGHSIGGPYVLTFTVRYSDEVKGLVMVDASHPDQFRCFEQAVGKSIRPSPTVPKIGAALAWTGLVRLLP
jgi:pimeloyl-ACP methyl ester carboxylesterase